MTERFVTARWSTRSKAGTVHEHVGVIHGYVSHKGRIHALVKVDATKPNGKRRIKPVRVSKLEW